MIAENLADVRARIAAAAARAGRDPTSIQLLAVSKTKPAEAVAEAYAAGQRAFGENYAQELETKHAALAHLKDLDWHFVGRLQTNKAKVVAKIAKMVHAVDGERLARELGKRAEGREAPLDVLVEVNVGGEASKGGVAPGDLAPLLSAIEAIGSLRLRGLMSIPPPTPDAESSRRFHHLLRSIRDAHGGPARLPELSMGMTDDLEVAIEEGATIVRVGTAIFGARTART
ncbi:MAG: YggS family pyridoxal phosphate-dependent enzyme [Deltaproteobacteria bacterium]|nr:YggS family pyridoxal phosphate-dependent enzyme [Deltaproteobacteria bacterium]